MADELKMPKALRAQITRSSLVLSAAALLREEGPDMVTNRRVAAWAGTSPSAVSYFFESSAHLRAEAGADIILLWIQRAERAAELAESLSHEECRRRCIALLIRACLPESSTAPATHYAQLVEAGKSAIVTSAYRRGRRTLDTAVKRILDHAEIDYSPRLVYALIDGAALEAISEGYNVYDGVAAVLSEALDCEITEEEYDEEYDNYVDLSEF